MTDFLISRRGELLTAMVNEELVGLDLDAGAYFSFNPTAQRVWALIEQPRSLTSICDELQEEFDVEPDSCATEVLGLLRQLESDGLVSLEPT